MSRTLPLLVVLTLGPVALSHGDYLPVLRHTRQDLTDPAKAGNDKMKELDKEKKNGNGKAEAGNGPTSVPPVLFPQEVFPAPASAIMDPRTGAWEQVWGGAYVLNVPTTAQLMPPTPLLQAEPEPKNPMELPVPKHKEENKPIPMPPMPQSKLVPETSKPTSAPERTIRFHRNAQTGAWEISNVNPQD